MSNMPGNYENADVQMYQEPERTSIMAILSLVFGVGGCCFGVTSILAVPFSIVGMLGISRSKGRVGGMGLAIAGLIVGLITLALWAGLIIGGGSAWYTLMKGAANNVETVLVEIQNGNLDQARGAINVPASQISDEDLLAFQSGYSDEVGAYVSGFSGFGELISGYMAVGEQMNSFAGRNDVLPVPMRFNSGWVLVAYQIDPSGGGMNTANGVPLPQSITIISADGDRFTLPANGSSQSTPDNQGMNDQNADDSGQEPADEPSDETPGGP